MTHGLGPGKPGPRAAKPITPPYVENNYQMEVKITFMLIAYLVLLFECFWEFSIFHFCRPLVDSYWHPLLKCSQVNVEIIETFSKFGGHSLSVFEVIQPFSERASKASLPSLQGLKRAGLNGVRVIHAVISKVVYRKTHLKGVKKSSISLTLIALKAFRFEKVQIKEQKFLPPLRFNL